MLSQPNPFVLLVHSRKFWLAVLDLLGLVGGMLATRYFSPADVDLMLKVGLSAQPIIGILIGAIAHEDAATIKAAAQTAAYQSPDSQTVEKTDHPGGETTTVTTTTRALP